MPEARARARSQAVDAARGYLREHGEPLPEGEATSLLLAGHQPELFHPGVWVKNFALAGLARRQGATALNLVVDNDTLKSTFLRLPAPPDADVPVPHFARVPFDEWHGAAPWEERGVLDAALFDSFADRAGAVLRPWGYEPLLAPFWGWRAGQARRGRLFARQRSTDIELRAGSDVWPALPRRGATSAWLELEGRGLKVRSRALTTTLYARLFLADLFIHGIGGGKYDGLTDELMREFYGGEPPRFLVLSATRRLPLPGAAGGAGGRRGGGAGVAAGG